MKIIVVGAGAAGLAAAFTTSSAGHEVHVFDPTPDKAAAFVAAGRLAPVVEVEFGETAMTTLCLAANKRWDSWSEQLQPFAPNDDWYQRSAMIVAARDNDDIASIRRLADYQSDLGLQVEALNARSIRKLEPALSPNVVGGLLVEQDHMVDNRILLSALRDACRHYGATFVAERVHSAGPRNVETDNGSFSADAVILAAGAWMSQIVLEPGLKPIAVHPVKGQILRLESSPTSIFPTHPIDGLDVYLVPRTSGELVVGASVEDLGFDDTITAGAVYELLKRGRELVPGIDEMKVAETSVGFRPATLDHTPVIGAIGPDGPFVAAGLYRNGILLAPTIGDEVLHWVQGSPVSKWVEPFTPHQNSSATDTNPTTTPQVQ